MRALLLLLSVLLLIGDAGATPSLVQGVSPERPVVRLSAQKAMSTAVVNKNERERRMAAMLLLVALSAQQHN